MNYHISKNFNDISKIPTDWKNIRLKYVLSISDIKSSNFSQEKILSLTQKGIVERNITTNEGQIAKSYEEYILVKQGQICMNPMDLLSGWVDISSFDGLISPAYYTFILNKKFDNKFINYFLQSNYLRKTFFKLGKGVASHDNFGRWVLTSEELKNIFIFFPKIEEQKLISHYLDKKFIQIDRLVKKIQKKIELLKEKRSVLINRCVTKGLDTNVEMKDSGVDWIGDIPKHWKKSRVKYKCILKTGNSLNENQKEMYSSDSNDKIPYISSKNIDLEKNFINYKTGIKLPSDEPGFAISPIGSFLIVVEGGSTGKKIGYQDRDVYYVNKLCSIFNLDKTKFIYYFFQSKIIQSFFEKSITGLIGGVSVNNIGNFFLPLPDPKEQKIISDYLDTKIESLDLLISKSQRKVALLKEYVQSLIFHVVTGKIRITKEMI